MVCQSSKNSWVFKNLRKISLEIGDWRLRKMVWVKHQLILQQILIFNSKNNLFLYFPITGRHTDILVDKNAEFVAHSFFSVHSLDSLTNYEEAETQGLVYLKIIIYFLSTSFHSEDLRKWVNLFFLHIFFFLLNKWQFFAYSFLLNFPSVH